MKKDQKRASMIRKASALKPTRDYALCYAVVKIETNLIVIRCKIKKKKKDPIVDFPLEICKFVCARTRVLFFSFFFSVPSTKIRERTSLGDLASHTICAFPLVGNAIVKVCVASNSTSRCYDIIYVYICIQHTHEYIINN